MRNFSCVVLTLVLALVAGNLNARTEVVKDPSKSDLITELFVKKGVEGTLVVASSAGKILHTYNAERAQIRFSPASTFKILNTLIALDAELVTPENSKFEWDGKQRSVSAWNADQTLRSAFKVSCVWCYQEIARNLGISTYVAALSANKFGNERVGDQVDLFWLNGELKISAMEQIEFLKKVNDYSVPYRRDHVDSVKLMMLDEQTSGYSIHAKSGWAASPLNVGWYVGYIAKGSEQWLFAMNMQMHRPGQAELRKKIMIQSLQILEII